MNTSLVRRSESLLRRFRYSSRVQNYSQSPSSQSPRVIFSGIQPTGIPHVILLSYKSRSSKLTTIIARQLLRSLIKLGQITSNCSSRGRTAIYYSGMARFDPSARSKGTAWFENGHASYNTGYWNRSLTVDSFPSRPSKLHHTVSCKENWFDFVYRINVTQSLHGSWVVLHQWESSVGWLHGRYTLHLCFSVCIWNCMGKARLAASRNANDKSEVGESLLNIGLFTYPILQAADILAYK